jgi:hypothetical protein
LKTCFFAHIFTFNNKHSFCVAKKKASRDFILAAIQIIGTLSEEHINFIRGKNIGIIKLQLTKIIALIHIEYFLLILQFLCIFSGIISVL